tara:strand:+ start:1021 stop:1668 length:648 start_codon:yes stop_codon:yes gene_type:complete
MIVTWSFLGIILIIGFIFLGIKMSESVKQGDIKIFFLALYTITLITFINIGISFYFYAKTVKKKGHKGLRGLQGKVGDKGDSGYCEDSCKVNSLKLFIIEKVREYVKENSIDLTNIEQKVCRYFNFIDNNDYPILGTRINNKEEEVKIKNLKLEEYKYIKYNYDFTNFINEIKKLKNDGSIDSSNHFNEDNAILNLSIKENEGENIQLIYIHKSC